MQKLILYTSILLMLLQACETIYEPELSGVENVLVIDARFEAASQEHRITLKKSRGFTEEGYYEPVGDAVILLADDRGTRYMAKNTEAGVYVFHVQLDSQRMYRLQVEAEGELYLSDFEQVPFAPKTDTIYSRDYEQWIQPGGTVNTGSFEKMTGKQLLVDIYPDNHPGYYLFKGRKVLQFMVEVGIPGSGIIDDYHYGWKSYKPVGSYNLAGPAPFTGSNDITGHPVDFFPYDTNRLLDTTEFGMGWIYIMHQYRITEQSYRYYSELKKQLDADGKIFDPLYIQPAGNLQCISSPGKIVLGWFGILAHTEHRFFIKLNRTSGITIRRINVFHDIPEEGVVPTWPPVFWER